MVSEERTNKNQVSCIMHIKMPRRAVSWLGFTATIAVAREVFITS